MITDATQHEMSEDDLDEHIRRLAVDHGRPVLNMLVAMGLNGMRELKAARPGAQMGGIAGYLQDQVSEFGEPWKSIVHALTDAMRLGAGKASESADEKIKETWRTWGPDAVAIAASLIVILYGEVGNARSETLEEAWAKAAAYDQRKIAEYLAQPVVVAEQSVWDAGLTEKEYRTLLNRIQAAIIGVHAFGRDGVDVTDLATTPGRDKAIHSLMMAIQDQVQRNEPED